MKHVEKPYRRTITESGNIAGKGALSLLRNYQLQGCGQRWNLAGTWHAGQAHLFAVREMRDPERFFHAPNHDSLDTWQTTRATQGKVCDQSRVLAQRARSFRLRTHRILARSAMSSEPVRLCLAVLWMALGVPPPPPLRWAAPRQQQQQQQQQLARALLRHRQ